jgi:hypothetical protein
MVSSVLLHSISFIARNLDEALPGGKEALS